MSQRDEIEVTAFAAVRMSPRQIAARKIESSNCAGNIKWMPCSASMAITIHAPQV